MLDIKTLRGFYGPDLYAGFSQMTSSFDGQIKKDVDRTGFKGTPEELEAHKQVVTRVLRAYANLDAECGYGQGINFIVEMLKHYIPQEEKIFWCLTKIMVDYEWRGFFLPGMVKAT